MWHLIGMIILIACAIFGVLAILFVAYFLIDERKMKKQAEEMHADNRKRQLEGYYNGAIPIDFIGFSRDSLPLEIQVLCRLGHNLEQRIDDLQYDSKKMDELNTKIQQLDALVAQLRSEIE